MRGILTTIIITVILVSLFELLLPGGNIKKVAASVMGIIAMAIILSPIATYFQQSTNETPRVYLFSERRDE